MKSMCAWMLCACGVGMWAGEAGAAIVAADDFSYADGSLAGQGTAGGGWADPWRTGCCGPQHDIVGGQLTSSSDLSRMHRDLATDLGADNTSLYIGVDYEFGGFYNGFEAHNDGDDDPQRVLQLAFENSQELIVGSDGIDFAEQTGMHRYVIALEFGTAGGDSVELFVDGVSVGSTPLVEEFVADRVGFGSFTGTSGTSFADNLIIATTFAEASGVVPEPGCAGLFVVGCSLAMRRRRR